MDFCTGPKRNGLDWPLMVASPPATNELALALDRGVLECSGGCVRQTYCVPRGCTTAQQGHCAGCYIYEGPHNARSPRTLLAVVVELGRVQPRELLEDVVDIEVETVDAGPD